MAKYRFAPRVPLSALIILFVIFVGITALEFHTHHELLQNKFAHDTTSAIPLAYRELVNPVKNRRYANIYGLLTLEVIESKQSENSRISLAPGSQFYLLFDLNGRSPHLDKKLKQSIASHSSLRIEHGIRNEDIGESFAAKHQVRLKDTLHTKIYEIRYAEEPDKTILSHQDVLSQSAHLRWIWICLTLVLAGSIYLRIAQRQNS